MAKECRSRMAKRLGNEYPNRDNKERCKPSGAVREHWPTKSWRKEFPFRPIKSESQKSPKSTNQQNCHVQLKIYQQNTTSGHQESRLTCNE